MTDKELTLDEWLGKLYQAEARKKLPAAVEEFKNKLGASVDLSAQARFRLASLEEMIAARGERACAFSTAYRNYLREALA